MNPPFRGSYLCGEVRYELDEFTDFTSFCHCKMCRKFHGAAFSTMAAVPADKFRWTQGEDALQKYTAPNETVRTFCRHCGSSLSYWSPRARQDIMEIAIGSLDDDCPIRPNAHIFTDFGANWLEWGAELPCYREGRDGPLVSD